MNNTKATELEMALKNLLFALKEYNRALASVAREGNQLVRELIDYCEVELATEPDSDYHDQVGDKTSN